MKIRLIVMFFATVSLAMVALGGARSDDPLGVAVSPQKLLLGVVQSGQVTVHTDIPYSTVDKSSLALNGVSAAGTGVDSCGNIVVVFDEEEIKAIVTVPSTVLTLTGAYVDGGAFSGSDTVMVEESVAPTVGSKG